MSARRAPAHDLRVVAHGPHRERLIIAVAVFAVCLAAGLGYAIGRHHSAVERERAVERLDALTTRHVAVVAERDELQQQLSDERLAHDMDRSSAGVLRETMSDQAAQITQLEDKLRFYRNLMASDGKVGEIEIAEFELMQKLDGPGVRFRMLLVQPSDRGMEVSGRVALRVRGAQNGKEEVLTGVQLGAPEDSIPFRFRYFQNVAGEIELPEGFVPEGVEIVARADGRDGFELQRQFSWQLREV